MSFSFFADMVCFGKIYTGEKAEPFASAFAVKNGQFIYVGQKSGAEMLIGPETRTLRLISGCVLPGMTEGHAHVTMTADLLTGVCLYQCHTIKDYLNAVSTYLDKHPDLTVLTGKGYITSIFGEAGPTADLLDEACPDIPAVLTAEDCHSAWINTKALSLLQLGKLSFGIKNGEIVCYPGTNNPTGWLKESAADLTVSLIPPYSISEYKNAILVYQEMALSNGITNCFEPFLAQRRDYAKRMEAYHQLDQEGQLHITFHTAYTLYPDCDIDCCLREASDLRNQYLNDEHISLTAIKIYADGVLENHTAFLLFPYADKTEDCGTPLWSQVQLNKIALAAAANGFIVHAHAIGDGAVEQVIQAYECAAEKYPGLNHAITHLQVMNRSQIRRMARTCIHAVVNPYWHFKDSLYFDALEIPYLGVKRAEEEYPLASLVETGVHVSQASDWPVSVPASTFLSFHIMVNRSEPGSLNPEQLKPTECLSPEESLLVLTAEGAHQMGLSEKKGTISVDKDADFVIIDNDVLTMEPQRIYTTRVLSTYVHGQKVWSSIKQT